MRLLVDTNRLTDALRLDDSVTQLIEEAEEVYVPFIALGEIQAGFAGGHPRRRAENEARLLAFLKMPSVIVLCADRETTSLCTHVRATAASGHADSHQ